MIEPAVVGDVVQRHGRARLRIVRPEDEPANSRVHHRAHAHETRLERDDERRFGEPVRTESLGCPPERPDLRVTGRVMGPDAGVARPRHDPAVDRHDGPDGDLLSGSCATRFRERDPHEVDVGGAGGVTATAVGRSP